MNPLTKPRTSSSQRHRPWDAHGGARILILLALISALVLPAPEAWSAYEADIATDVEESGTPPVETEPPNVHPEPEPEPAPVPTVEPLDVENPEPLATVEPAPLSSPHVEEDDATSGDPTIAPTVEPNGNEFSGAGEVMTSASIPRDADPGSTVSYPHTLTHIGDEPASYVVSTNSSLGWPVMLFAEDGLTPLTDEGVAMSGLLAPGETWKIVVAVTVPEDAIGGIEDIITTTVALSHLPEHVLDIIKDRTRVRSVLTLRLHSRRVNFGDVSPDGRLSLRQWNVSATTDDAGAYYIMDNAVGVTVFSNTSWTGTCHAEENSGSATTIRIADGDLAWRLSNSLDWNGFTSAPYDNACFPVQAIGVNTYQYDLRLHVAWEDEPGTFESKVIFEASA